MYGKGMLTNSLITKARSTVATYYAIPGNLTPEEIGSRARWLITKGVFRYGGVNVTVGIFYFIPLNSPTLIHFQEQDI